MTGSVEVAKSSFLNVRMYVNCATTVFEYEIDTDVRTCLGMVLVADAFWEECAGCCSECEEGSACNS